MQAEGYLLCDDTPSCNLELKDVEAILGVARCVRLRENKREAVQKHARLNAEISTMDIVLRESSESTHILGASPSLTRQLFNIPDWLYHSWNDCRMKGMKECQYCYTDPLRLAILVFKFFTLHAAISDLEKGNKNWLQIEPEWSRLIVTL